jgi:hypothetical protein
MVSFVQTVYRAESHEKAENLERKALWIFFDHFLDYEAF